MNKRLQDRGGFSLIELVVIVGLMGLVLAFALPATVSFMKSGRVTGASQTLTADIHYARSLAKSQGTTYQIRFGSTSYRVVRVSPAATVLSRTLASGVTCTATDTAWFYSWGLTKPVTVRLTNGHGTEVLALAANGSVTQ